MQQVDLGTVYGGSGSSATAGPSGMPDASPGRDGSQRSDEGGAGTLGLLAPVAHNLLRRIWKQKAPRPTPSAGQERLRSSGRTPEPDARLARHPNESRVSEVRRTAGSADRAEDVLTAARGLGKTEEVARTVSEAPAALRLARTAGRFGSLGKALPIVGIAVDTAIASATYDGVKEGSFAEQGELGLDAARRWLGPQASRLVEPLAQPAMLAAFTLDAATEWKDQVKGSFTATAEATREFQRAPGLGSYAKMAFSRAGLALDVVGALAIPVTGATRSILHQEEKTLDGMVEHVVRSGNEEHVRTVGGMLAETYKRLPATKRGAFLAAYGDNPVFRESIAVRPEKPEPPVGSILLAVSDPTRPEADRQGPAAERSVPLAR